MRILIATGPVILLDLRLFETMDPAAPDARVVRHEHYHYDDEGPTDGDMRKLRGEDE